MAGLTIRGESSPRPAGSTQDQDLPKPDEVQSQLRAILASPAFHGSKRCQQFLEYVCDKSLAGEASALKERTVAIDVFGRQPQSELGEDTIVRVGAREVRKRLAQFYVSPEGVASRVKIDLPAGSYAPEFHYAVAMVEKEAPAAPAAVAVAQPARSRKTLMVAGAVALVLVAVGVALLSGVGRKPDLLRQFWKPVFDSSEPLLVGVANPLTYHPSLRAQKLNENRLPVLKVPRQRPIQLPAKELDGNDFIASPDQYVGVGDLVAVTQISAMLARHGKSMRLRLSDNISFADLRLTPALLIGSLTNKWTMEFQPNWRFQFTFTPETSVLVDTYDKPAPGARQRQWVVTTTDDGAPIEDYVLISRIKNPWDRDVALKQALGVPADVFTRAENLLRL